jgi:hypothetical protein
MPPFSGEETLGEFGDAAAQLMGLGAIVLSDLAVGGGAVDGTHAFSDGLAETLGEPAAAPACR